MIAAVGSWAFAAAFIGIGRWGRNNSADLVPTSFSAAGRAKKERSLRRGAWSMTIFGWMFALLGLVIGVSTALGNG